MSNVKKIFGGTSKSGTYYIDLKAHVNGNNELFISIQDHEKDFPIRFICLEFDTAVAFLDEVQKCVVEMNTDSE